MQRRKREREGKRRSADLPQGKEGLYAQGVAMTSSGDDVTTGPKKEM
jgi:hypothetical protein